MKNHLKKFGFIFLMICYLANTAKAATFDWNGVISGNWFTNLNWTVGGFPTLLYPGDPGRSGSSADVVRFGVAALSLYLFQPTLTLTTGQSLTIGSVIFGPNQYNSGSSPFTGTTLTVTAGTLNVANDITLNVFTGGGSLATQGNFLKGTGTINCADDIIIGVGAANAAKNYYLFSEIANLNVSSDVLINLRSTLGNGSGFRLQQGNMSIAGQILFANTGSVTANNASFFTIDALNSAGVKSTVTLTLSNPNAIGGPRLTNTGGSNLATVNFNGTSVSNAGGGGSITVIYTGLNPTVYITSTASWFGTGGGTINTAISAYNRLIINSTGTATIGNLTGTLMIDSAFTTSSNTTFVTFSTNTIIGATGSTAATWTNNSAATITGGVGTTDINGTLSNAGIMNMGTGALTIAKDYTNTGTFSPNATPTITFDGTTQSLTDATSTGTNFYNVTFSIGGTKSMALGSKFTVAPLYTLSVIGSSTLAVGNATPTTTALTILSASAGDASIGSLAAGTITGSINVQRYVKGILRRYMLLSSPVTNTTFAATAVKAYNLLPLIATTYITGPSGGGFDSAPATGNSPSVFIYDEDAPVTTDPNQVVGNEYKPFNTTSEGVPAANGFLYYFRGSRSIANPFVRPFPATDNATLNFFGDVIKGSVATNAPLTANIINFPSTPPTNYSAAGPGMTAPATLSFSATTPPIKQGLNLIGNPYASVIDLQALYLVNPSNKFYYMLVKDASTGAFSSSTKFALYDANLNSVGTGASRYALSGQGFFTLATSASAITFNETMKVAYSAYTAAPSAIPIFNIKHNSSSALATLAVSSHDGNLQKVLASSAANNAASADVMPRLKLELVKDSIIHNTTDINFDKNASSKFIQGEDAPYYQPSGQGDLLYSLTADSIGCFANYTTTLEKLKRINLIVTFSNYGLYKITAPYKANIDERYTIFLKDKYTNDSLDVGHNPEYAFNVDKNAASYAHDRFYLSIGIAPGHEYKLLDFNGAKVTAGIQLNWKTDNESTFTKFAIEKSTNGGKSFIVIDSLESTDAGNYTFIDPAPGIGQITYRLAQTLVAGDTQLSKNLVFDYSDITRLLTFMVYPSNALQDIHIRLGKTYSNRIKINIVSANGSMVKTIIANNTDVVQQNIGNLIKGLYIVEAIDEATGKRIGSAKFFRQ